MWWCSEIVYLFDKPNILISYFSINKLTKIVEIHKKLVKDEDEFVKYYNEIKSL